MESLKLIFSSGFDSYVFKKQHDSFNVKFVGELQLLASLERELGLSGVFTTNADRELEYLKVLTETIKGKESFISESFKEDEIGVANELLRWRDQLTMMGWNFQQGISDRLDLLAEIESKKVLSQGIADRWIMIHSKLQSIADINISEIEIFDNLEFMHPFYRELFGLLEKLGVKISLIKPEYLNSGSNLDLVKDAVINGTKDIDLNENDHSINIIRFCDDLVAADFLADQLKLNPDFNPVIINSDNTSFDAALATYDLPFSGSKIKGGNPQLIQLFKLIPSLLFKNINPYNLLSFLNLPLSPIRKSLSKQLSSMLIETSGIDNEGWNNSISNFLGAIEDDKDRKKQQAIIELYLLRERVEQIEVEEIKTIYRDISTWAITCIQVQEPNDELRLQLLHISNMAEQLIKTVKSLDKITLSARGLEKIINKIYEPISFSLNSKQKGSYTVIEQAGQLYDNADTMVWFDFHSQLLNAANGDFLFQSEIDKLLENNNVLFWDRGKQILFLLQQLEKGFLKTNKQLFLFIPEKVKGAATSQHPLYINLLASVKNIDAITYDFELEGDQLEKIGLIKSKTKSIRTKVLPAETINIEINNSHLLKEREKESFSSLDNLIKYPIDWVLNYQAKISDRGLGDISELMTIKGNLSHFIIQTLFEKDKNQEINLQNVDLDKEIDDLLETYTRQYAIPLLLEENKFDYKLFASQLKTSAKNLFALVAENKLIYKNFEENVSGKINTVMFGGNIDLLFYKGSTPVIIDLKWTFSTKKYHELIKSEKSVQLALYAGMLDEKAITAYFLLSAGVMYTASPELTGEHLRLVDVDIPAELNKRILNKAINSYNYRWSELKKGTIELAENMPMDDIQYAQDTEAMDLIPLDESAKAKKGNYYSSNGLFKGGVK